jgi:septal ring factor EnvC (AmiA/AmiB activator)
VTEHNIKDMLAFVNQSIEVHALPGPLRLDSSTDDTVQTLQCLIALLRQRQSDGQAREELATQLQQQKSEVTRLQARLQDSRSQIEDLTRENHSIASRLTYVGVHGRANLLHTKF